MIEFYQLRFHLESRSRFIPLPVFGAYFPPLITPSYVIPDEAVVRVVALTEKLRPLYNHHKPADDDIINVMQQMN